jgi:hypothetical protein
MDRYLYGALAVVFGLTAFAGFARTYYLKLYFASPALPSVLVHLHGIVMTAWVVLFIVQVSLISAHRVRAHRRLGYTGIGLAVLVVTIGVWTALRAARYGSASVPVGFSEPTFAIVPLGDMALFTLFFGGAVYFRRQAARHKFLMLLTVATFLPPAIGRLPFTFIQDHPVPFLLIPSGLALGGLAFDTWRRRRVDRLLLTAAVVFVASFPVRIALIGTPAWASAAAWLATLVD